MDAMKHFTEGMIKENKPQFEVGDTVRVSVRIKEGDNSRGRLSTGGHGAGGFIGSYLSASSSFSACCGYSRSVSSSIPAPAAFNTVAKRIHQRDFTIGVPCTRSALVKNTFGAAIN